MYLGNICIVQQNDLLDILEVYGLFCNNIYINYYFILVLILIFVYVFNKFCCSIDIFDVIDCSIDIFDVIDCVVMGFEFLKGFQYKVGIWS